MDRVELFDLYTRHVNAGKIAVYERFGLDAVIGERTGIRFRDRFDPNRSWINCHGNGGVFNLGHRHPRVVAAVEGSLAREDIGNHHLPAPGRAVLARRLAATTGGRLPGVVFGVAGGEAVDLALKVARGATGRQQIVSAVGGYHGHTGLAMATGDPEYRDPFGPNLPGFTQVPFDDIDALAAVVTDDTAAVILEPIPATLGMPIPSPGYLVAVQEICRDLGALFLVDEVQTGLGRTGRIWAYEHWDLEPDMVITGKGLSGGVYPISATLMTRSLHSVFDQHPFIHVSTFGGAEPGCAAALAVLDVIEAPGFLDHVAAIGRRLAAGLSGMPFELRRLGMMMGFAFPAPDAGMLAAKLLFDAGVFAVYANNDTSVLQFLPPLTTTEEEADEIIGIVRSVFG
ncbi:MAG: aminotransferase class III-fold pyridoxal phosphate-dependent enzyme [Acidimicrobiia bacterium]|nr:aminotransferase class III-fold pyridoxal phosphate-dependent enzyme [Acidimicrobiia bacterium]